MKHFPRKYADLGFAARDTKETADLRFADLSLQVCGFAICRLAHFRNLQLQNEPKNLRICDLRTSKTNLRAHLC
jgi:hypothetical protein